jgi:uncharacterized protein
MIESNRFLDAARNGDIETVQQYLKQASADLECRGYLNMTSLLLASMEGHTDVAGVLVAHGADIHNAWYPETKAGTALEMAAERGHADIVDLLLAAGSEVNNPLSGKSPALIEAARGGHLSIVERLLDAGADGRSVTADNTTVLILISGFGPKHVLNPDLDLLKGCMRRLMDAGVDVNTVDNLRSNALTRAVNADNEAIVKFLLDSGADPNLAASHMIPGQLIRHTRCLNRLIDAGLDNDIFVTFISSALLEGPDRSALSLAEALPENIRDLHIKGVQFVIDCKTDDLDTFSNHVKAHAGTDILAAYGGIAVSITLGRVRKQFEKTRILIDAGAEINISSGYHSPIVKACRSGHKDLVQLLLDHGADPNPGDDGMVSPLMIVYGADKLYHDRNFPAKGFDDGVEGLAKALMDAGAVVNARTSEDLTALMIAVQMFPFNLDRLIAAGADLNAQSKNGWTALMWADVRNTRHLIRAGADVSTVNKDGRTALFLSDSPTKADALRKAGANPAHRDLKGMTPLMYHAQQGNMKMVKWFSKYKKNRNALDDNGNNAVLYALGNNCVEVVKYLVDLGEDPNIVNHHGDTLLIMACRSAKIDLIRLALSLKPDLDAVNKAGETALMICCQYHDDGSTAKRLIRHGADPFLKGSNGRTALDMAVQFKSEKAVDSIRKLIFK